MVNRNDQLIALAVERGAPAYLIDFMRAYPHHVPTVGFIATAYRRYVQVDTLDQ